MQPNPIKPVPSVIRSAYTPTRICAYTPTRMPPQVEQVIPHFEKLQQLQLRPVPVLPDERNKDIYIHVGGRLVKRREAKVSVFDSSVQGGDAVWEGLRVYAGKVFALDEHVERLLNSSRALAFEEVPSAQEIKAAVFETLHKNRMYDECHIRLTLTRGEKVVLECSRMYDDCHRIECIMRASESNV